MRNSIRNTLVRWASLGAQTACAAALVWVMYFVEGRASGRWVVMLVAVAVGWAGILGWNLLLSAQKRRLDAEARAAGVELPDEPGVPVRWAANRESLVVGVVALAIIAAVFGAYYSGWFGGGR